MIYPSVTVCKKYTFDHYIDYIFGNKSLTMAEVVQTADSESWDVQELFYFFTQPNKKNAREELILFLPKAVHIRFPVKWWLSLVLMERFLLRFPCTTVYGGTRPGQVHPPLDTNLSVSMPLHSYFV